MVSPSPPRPRPNPSLFPTSTEEAAASATPAIAGEPELSLLQHVGDVFKAHPYLKCKWEHYAVPDSGTGVIGTALFFGIFQFAVVPSLVPVFLFSMYSFWLPQIWRNARRGTSHALDHGFVIGTSIGRLVLPLCMWRPLGLYVAADECRLDAFACPDNVFFVNKQDWVWGLVGWHWAQILMLFAQERFGPSFL